MRYTPSILAFLTVLGIFRLFTPIDLKFAYVIQSSIVLPAIVNALRMVVPGTGFNLGELLIFIWVLGTAFWVAKYILKWLRFAKETKKFEYLNSAQAERIVSGFGKYTVRVSTQVSMPYVAGLINPVIYLPYMELTDNEMLFVLRHEIQHIKSHDVIKKLLFLCIQAVFWWNPLAHISMSEIDVILEMQCDAKLTAAMNEKEVYKYMRSLLAVMKQISPEKSDSSLCTSALLGTRPDILQRFEVMQNARNRASRKQQFLLICVITLLFALSYVVIIQPFTLPPVEADEGVIEITPYNAYIVNEGEQYYLYVDGKLFGTASESEIALPPLNELELR